MILISSIILEQETSKYNLDLGQKLYSRNISNELITKLGPICHVPPHLIAPLSHPLSVSLAHK